MALDIKKFIDRFVDEARDHLSRIAEGLAALDRNPGDKENINVIFRSAHTIKGSSKMLKLGSINETAHCLEDVLDALRNGKLSHSPALLKILFRGTDALAALVDGLARGEALPPADARVLELLAQALAGAPPVDAESAASDSPGPEKAAPLALPDTVRVRLDKLDELIKLMNEVVSGHVRSRQRLQEIRAIDRLDFPLAQSGEERLDLLQQEIRRFSQQMRDDLAVQDLLINELHGKAMIMRMLPLAIVFDPMGRMVRDIAQGLGKDVECLVSGSEIELDRQMIDTLSDPILHLLRNSVDHGIEEPPVRQARGKPARGRISISARQDGGWVLIEVADDGGGIALEAIREKAQRKGLVAPDKLAAMSDREIMDLIFLPGFSTSPIITDLSGRGVGLDVVRTSIVDDLQGMVQVESRFGAGTVFSLRLPLSLAVMRVLLVRTGGLPLGFTAQYIEEIVRSPEQDFRMVAGRRVVLMRNEFIPVLALSDLLQLPATAAAKTTARAVSEPEAAGTLILVVSVHGDKLALSIDELVDERDMVIKPLPAHLHRINLVSGMVTTGTNELVNIIHVPALMEKARAHRGEGSLAEQSGAAALAPRVVRILVVDDSLNTREIERDVLEAYGYQVTLAEHGLDGLQKAESQAFDAVLTDVEMPQMDGFTLTERLRQNPQYQDTPIIILSSRQKEEDKRRGIQAGADAYIIKGDFDQGSLVEILRNFGL